MGSVEQAMFHSREEERVHAATHAAGALLAVAALVLLVLSAVGRSALTIVAVAVFGATLVALYVASSVYHAMPNQHALTKRRLEVLDHVAIHLLIAGTYTPFALTAIGGAWGWVVFGVVWSVAAFGVVVESTPLGRSQLLSMALYLGAGWLLVLALPLFWSALSASTWVWLALGGGAYTLGVPFYLASRTKWMHALWHLFVLLGSAAHVIAISTVIG